MSAFARASDRLRVILAALGLWLGAACAHAAPERVVSLNLCTDQLAMLLAAPGQLVSVSFLSQDPRSSSMAGQARAYPANHGRAEEVFLLTPDLVLAGSYTSRAAVSMLERLGVRVEVFPPERSFNDIRAHLRRMGALLGQEARAEALIAQFDADLAELQVPGGARPNAALYSANGYTTGTGTLADEILQAGGFDNLAAQAGLPGGGTLALERLVLLGPDLILTSPRYPGDSRAEALMDHPALGALMEGKPILATDADWTCGTPYVLRAVARLVALRRGMETGG